ncbi:MAG: ribonuclease catalytic domain-containing protein [Pseudomonadota bacterium]
MQLGDIVEFISEKQLIGGVILGHTSDKVRIVTEGGREVSLGQKRLLTISPRSCDPSSGRAYAINQLSGILKQRASLAEKVSVPEIWEVLNIEQRWYEAEEVAELWFGSQPSSDKLSAVIRAFFGDRIYFKFDGRKFWPHTQDEVDQIVRRREEDARKEALIEAGATWITGRHAKTTSPAGTEELIPALKSFYVFGKKSPFHQLAKAILDRAGVQSRDRIFEILVSMGEWENDENLDLIENSVPDSFPQEVINDAERIALNPQTFMSAILTGRKDLTHLSTITIDGEYTSDFDDALSVEPEGDGYRIWVHISDVAEYISQGCPTDQEAITRASSIYLPDKTIPMLPPILCNDICSLKGGKERPVVSVSAHIDPTGLIRDFEFFEGVVTVDRQLTYSAVDSLAKEDEALQSLYKAAQWFRNYRISSNAFLMMLPEIHVLIGENKLVSTKRVDREGFSHIIVSELMIMANWLAARFLTEQGLASVYRSQCEPTQRLIGKNGNDDPLLQHWLQRRFMSRAILTCTPEAHSGLGLDMYSTWTSPIRKYLDLVVQRQLKSRLRSGVCSYGKQEIERIIQQAEEPLKLITLLQQRRERYWLLKYLEQVKGREHEALVVEKRRDRLAVLLTDVMIEVSIPTSYTCDLTPGNTIGVIVDNASARLDTVSVSLVSAQPK